MSNDRYEVRRNGVFLHSWGTREAARKCAKYLDGQVIDLQAK